MEFIHAIDLSNFYPCHNISIDGKLFSPNFIALADPNGMGKIQKQLDDFTIEQLKLGQAEIGMPTPRFIAVCIEAALLRSDFKIVNGHNQEVLYSRETKEEKIKRADIELQFESVRREHFSNYVSRLNCLYLAERTSSGTSLIKRMLGNEVEILEVLIDFKINMNRVDVSWFDAYCKDPKREYIIKYWSGEPYSAVESWEYLFDGRIEVEDQCLINVLENGTSANDI